MNKAIHRLTYLACLTAAALCLAWLEFLLPLPIALPGVKLGLANLAALYALYRFGLREALLVSAARILLAAFLFGSLFSAVYALSGALCAALVMAGFKRLPCFSIYGVSMGGGVTHNIAQLAVAACLTQTAGILGYLPPLMLCGLVAGWLNGWLAKRLTALP